MNSWSVFVIRPTAIEKCSVHWRRGDGRLISRWDNAPHHPEISSFPNHIHDGDKSHVLAHEAVDVSGKIGTVLAAQANSNPDTL